MTNHPPGRQGGLADLASALPGTNVELEPGYVAFDLGDAFVEANMKDGAARVRIRAYLGYAERSIVEDWVQSHLCRGPVLSRSSPTTTGLSSRDWCSRGP